HQRQPHLGAGRAMLPTRAVGEVHDLFVRRLRAVRAAIARNTRRIEMAARWWQPPTCGRRGGNEAVEGRHAQVVEGIAGGPEGVILEMAGLQAWGKEARDRLMLEKMGPELPLVVEKAATVKPQGCDRLAGGHKAPFGVLLRRLVDDLGAPEFFQ